jgi:acyl-homoserine-lactone acylase
MANRTALQSLRTLFLMLLAVGMAASGPASAAEDPSGSTGVSESEEAPAKVSEFQATIRWDDWGIPHIRAEDEASLFYAQGWAHARNHGEQLVRNYGLARARAAEYWGEDHLESDRWFRLIRLPERSERAYNNLPPEVRHWMDAFAAGIQAYLDANPEALSAETSRALPVTAQDVLANSLAVGEQFSGADQLRLRWLEQNRDSNEQTASLLPERHAGERPGSNAWAVGPSHASGDNAMLLANPHLPWSGNLTWMEAHLQTPDVDIYGASLVGMPMISIGFNQHLGWTYTVNTQDIEDIYELKLEETDAGLVYRWGEETRPLQHETDIIKIRTDDGMHEEEIDLHSSVHGPVIAVAGDRALALREAVEVGNRTLGDAYPQWWAMARATDMEEFEHALKRNRVAGFNTIYADAEGNIAYYYGGVTPVRPVDARSFWEGIVPGDSPETLWDEVHSFEDMPRIVNPESGWVQNANDPPWHATWPRILEPGDFPEHFAPVYLALRPQRSIELMTNNGSISLEEMIELKHSTRMLMADRIVPELLEAVAEHGTERAKQAAAVLEAWDRSADADSRGAVLFVAWARAMLQGGPVYAEDWSIEEPLSTPDGLHNPETAASVLDEVAAQIESTHGGLDVTWGEVNRLRSGDLDLPGNGAPGALGVFRNVFYRRGEDGGGTAVGGDSFVAAIEFAETPRAFALTSYGNASQVGSAHNGDQLRLFAVKMLRPVHYTEEQIKAHTVETKVINSP